MTLLTAFLGAAVASAVAEDTKEGPLTLQRIAGTYYSSGPTGGSCRLELRPNGRYGEGCFQGVSVTTDRGRIELGVRRFALVAEGNPLRFEYPEDLDAVDRGVGLGDGTRRTFPPAWRLVEWGERRYIFSRPQLLDFCIAVAKGSEPRTRRVGPFYLREGDEAKAAIGPSPVRECDDPDVLLIRAERHP